jgi:hypothetical protein
LEKPSDASLAFHDHEEVEESGPHRHLLVIAGGEQLRPAASARRDVGEPSRISRASTGAMRP